MAYLSRFSEFAAKWIDFDFDFFAVFIDGFDFIDTVLELNFHYVVIPGLFDNLNKFRERLGICGRLVVLKPVCLGKYGKCYQRGEKGCFGMNFHTFPHDLYWKPQAYDPYSAEPTEVFLTFSSESPMEHSLHKFLPEVDSRSCCEGVILPGNTI